MQINYDVVARITILNFIILSLNGCAADNYRMQKYDPKDQTQSKAATVILGTKNISFVDFTKYTGIKTKAAVQKSTPVTTTVKTESKADTVEVSADPNRGNFPATKLSEIFKRKTRTTSSTNAAEHNNVSVDNMSAEDIENNNKYRVLKANRLFSYGYANSIYTVEPGIYYISYAYSNEDNIERHTQGSGLKDDGSVEYGAFEVKAGDIVYLGDIEIDWLKRDPAKMVEIKDNISTVKQELVAAQHQELADKIKAAKFLTSGYKLSSVS